MKIHLLQQKGTITQEVIWQFAGDRVWFDADNLIDNLRVRGLDFVADQLSRTVAHCLEDIAAESTSPREGTES